jgi:hypothetical protein
VLIHSVVITLTARLVSALLSFSIFAEVKNLLEPKMAVKVFFFSFVFGFCIATMRTFHLVATSVRGHEAKRTKIRKTRSAACELQKIQICAAPIVFYLLWKQGLGWPVAAVGLILVVLCGNDVDLIRSVMGRKPMLPLLTAGGGLLGLFILKFTTNATEISCTLAFLAQWLPVAIQRLTIGQRFFVARHRKLIYFNRNYFGGSSANILFALFDGAVLNAPFLLVIPLSASAAVDLALGNRLFVASLAIFSLISSWVISGDIEKIAIRYSIKPPIIYIAMQIAGCLIIGSVYAWFYQYIMHMPISFESYAIFLLVMVAYVVHSTGLRYLLSSVSVRKGVVYFAMTLVIFYIVMIYQMHVEIVHLWVVLTAIFITLLCPTLLLFNHKDKIYDI